MTRLHRKKQTSATLNPGSLMDQEALKDVIQWDIKNWSPCIDFWEGYLPKREKLSCLEVGARHGGLSLWLASLGHSVLCTDLVNPEEDARYLHDKYHLKGNITYQAIDAMHIPFSNAFDVIAFKSILGGIGRNNDYQKQKFVIRQMHHALKKDGILLFAENLAASKIHSLMRGMFISWGSSWRYINLDELPNLFSVFQDVFYTCNGLLGAFGRTEKQRRILGYLDSLIVKLMPDRWKYIVIGAARKT